MRTGTMRLAAVSVTCLVLAIQVVPYGRAHTNQPGRAEPRWDRSETRDLARRACFDCHSNETVWPWYASAAPVSWLVQRDVDEGRRKLNFSEWDRPQREARESGRTVERGKMPPWYYTPAHPTARLGAVEQRALARGLELTVRRTVARADAGPGPGGRTEEVEHARGPAGLRATP